MRFLKSFFIMFKAVKLPLQHVIRKREYIVRINELVLNTHSIVCRGTLLLKLFLLYRYESTGSLPAINKRLIECCLRVQYPQTNKGRKPNEGSQQIRNDVRQFYETHFKPICFGKTPSSRRMGNVLNYETERILTQYETNIKEHYFDYLKTYTRWSFFKDKTAPINTIVGDLVNVNKSQQTFKSPRVYHAWIVANKVHLLPNCDRFKNDNVAYDLKAEPLKYLQCMVYMMKRFQWDESTIPYNPFPLRTTCVPSHITLDTQTIANLLYDGRNKTSYVKTKLTPERKSEIWGNYFHTDGKCFRTKRNRSLSFHHMIHTDGVSCTLLFSKGTPVTKQNAADESIPYVSHADQKDGRKVIGIDPGVCDLIYCVDGEEKKFNKLRYSQDQRRKETKVKKYRKIADDKKPPAVKEAETTLSSYNKKSITFDTFRRYCAAKMQANHVCISHYKGELFRKLKVNLYLNAQKSEQRLINKFKEKFGTDCLLAWGNYSRGRGFKHKESTKGNGLRRLFVRNGFITLIIIKQQQQNNTILKFVVFCGCVCVSLSFF